MTSREYFAGQVLLALTLKMNSDQRRRYLTGHAYGEEVRLAWALADAMLQTEQDPMVFLRDKPTKEEEPVGT